MKVELSIDAKNNTTTINNNNNNNNLKITTEKMAINKENRQDKNKEKENTNVTSSISKHQRKGKHQSGNKTDQDTEKDNISSLKYQNNEKEEKKVITTPSKSYIKDPIQKNHFSSNFHEPIRTTQKTIYSKQRDQYHTFEKTYEPKYVWRVVADHNVKPMEIKETKTTLSSPAEIPTSEQKRKPLKPPISPYNFITTFNNNADTVIPKQPSQPPLIRPTRPPIASNNNLYLRTQAAVITSSHTISEMQMPTKSVPSTASSVTAVPIIPAIPTVIPSLPVLNFSTMLDQNGWQQLFQPQCSLPATVPTPISSLVNWTSG